MLRKMLDMSQAEFAKRIQISQGALSQIEGGKTHVSIGTLKKISHSFNINCNWLIHGQGDMFLPGQQAKAPPRSQKLVLPMSDEEKDTPIALVQGSDCADYCQKYDQPDYIRSLDTYQLPNFHKGRYRLFEITDLSMAPTLNPGEIVVAEYEPEPEDGDLCVIVYEQGVVARYIYRYRQNSVFFLLKSQQKSEKAASLERSRIHETWAVRSKITNTFLNPNHSSTQRVEQMRSDLRDLKAKIKGVRKKKR